MVASNRETQYPALRHMLVRHHTLRVKGKRSWRHVTFEHANSNVERVSWSSPFALALFDITVVISYICFSCQMESHASHILSTSCLDLSLTIDRCAEYSSTCAPSAHMSLRPSRLWICTAARLRLLALYGCQINAKEQRGVLDPDERVQLAPAVQRRRRQHAVSLASLIAVA